LVKRSGRGSDHRRVFAPLRGGEFLCTPAVPVAVAGRQPAAPVRKVAAPVNDGLGKVVTLPTGKASGEAS